MLRPVPNTDALSNAISVVSQALSVETAARTSADAALSARIDGVTGGAGSVTLTTAARGHIAGTFEFTLAAHEGALPADRRVSSGRFDVKY